MADYLTPEERFLQDIADQIFADKKSLIKTLDDAEIHARQSALPAEKNLTESQLLDVIMLMEVLFLASKEE